MADSQNFPAQADETKVAWADLFRDGRALYAVLVILGALLHALQILVIAIIMPTVVADIGGAAYYTWAAMIYTVGSIVGAAGVGPVWRALGRRKGYALSGIGLLAGTLGCAFAPDMAALIVARLVQGLGAGLVTGGSMALVSTLFEARMRTRLLALYQGTWMFSQLLGPLVGGVFAEFGWWRGSFWCMVPIVIGFSAIAWYRLPRDPGPDAAGKPGTGGFPMLRLALLASGVLCVGFAGPVGDPVLRAVLIAAAATLIWATFRLDGISENRLYPTGALSVFSPVGLALWVLFCVGLVQTTVTLFLPLLLQVVHGISPIYLSFVTMVVSFGWTVGTFSVSGWSGARERFALGIGPVLVLAGLAAIVMTTQAPALIVLVSGAFVLGFGIGTHNVHLVARTMAAARGGEESITASAMPSIRSLGTACGAAIAGMLSGVAGLGDASDPAAVGGAVTFVYAATLLPAALAVLFMFRLVRFSRPQAAAAA